MPFGRYTFVILRPPWKRLNLKVHHGFVTGSA
jgi:hypothetical protein